MKSFFSILGLVILDQLTKYLARMLFIPGIEVFSFFHLTFVENTGIAFSIPFPQTFLIILTSIFIIFMGHFLWFKKLKSYENYALLLLLAGAIGNLIDRIFLGKVTDFLAFWNFPIFNLADIYISVGVGLYLVGEIFFQKNSKTMADQK